MSSSCVEQEDIGIPFKEKFVYTQIESLVPETSY